VRFLFDTCVLIDYLHDPNNIAADALFVAADQGEVFVTLISLMELYLPRNRRKSEIREEVNQILELCRRLNIKIIPASSASQCKALDILRQHQASLNVGLPDSLIVGISQARRAYLVTLEDKLFRVSSRVISPVELVQRF
jgi:predicted nucleic acid-binding protein